MGKENIYYINKKEKEALGEIIIVALKHIDSCQDQCKKNEEMMEWARFQEKRKTLENFVAKIQINKKIGED